MKTSQVLIAAISILGLSMGVQAEMGVALLKGTAPDSTIAGTAALTDTPEGLKVIVNIAGAPAGQHGLHIHEFGSCEDLGKAAGGHYNPMNSPHGMIMKDGAKMAHKGDLGNIEIGPDGKGKLEATIKGLSLSNDKYTVGGRAIVFHEKLDDFGQPLGNAGGRIGCGVISIIGK